MSEQVGIELGSAGRADRRVSGDFVDPVDGYQDDDLINQTEEEVSQLEGELGRRNFIESDDFEAELGSPAADAFAEDFSDVAKHEIVDVVGADKAGRLLIVGYAMRLPPNKGFDHDKFLRYLMFTLDKYVDQDYTIVYFHYGLNSANKPPLRWLISAYRLLDRKYKKNLKALYLVHPTNFIKIVWNLFKPLISKKFERKLNYVNYLSELKELIRSDQLIIPGAIEAYDRKLVDSAKPSSWQRTVETQNLPQEPLETQQFGVTLQFILERHSTEEIPPVVKETVTFLKENGLLTEGLFRRSVNLSHMKEIRQRIDQGEHIDYKVEENGVHLAAVILKYFLRELKEPIIPFRLFDEILRVQSVPNDQRTAAVKNVVGQMPRENYATLKFIFAFLTEVMARSDVNLMNASNLSIVFGPNLAWSSSDPTSLHHLHHLNNFAYRLLTNFGSIFSS